MKPNEHIIDHFTWSFLDKREEVFSTNIKIIIDAPCGDYNWMKNLNYEFESYLVSI